MKTPIAITLIVVGGLLVAGPGLTLQWPVKRAAEYYEPHGGGSALPDELRPQPHGRYDWATLAVGGVFALLGVAGSMRSRASAK
jgi:hypothetical protein